MNLCNLYSLLNLESYLFQNIIISLLKVKKSVTKMNLKSHALFFQQHLRKTFAPVYCRFEPYLSQNERNEMATFIRIVANATYEGMEQLQRFSQFSYIPQSGLYNIIMEVRMYRCPYLRFQ